MACGGKQLDNEEELIGFMQNMSIDEQERCTPLCWTDSQIEVIQKEKRRLIQVLNVMPPIFQFFVQKQQEALHRLAKDHGFHIDFESSKNYLVAESIHYHTEEKMDGVIHQFVQSIENVCKIYDLKSFVIEDCVWPYVEKDFKEKTKSEFKECIVQVSKKSSDSYCLVGFAEYFGKFESLLSIFIKQHKAIKIENKEMFEALDMAEILRSRFKKVKLAVHEDLLLLNGEEKALEECAKCYKELAEMKNMHVTYRVVSENVYEFLENNKIKKKIYRSLKDSGFHVYWTVRKLTESYWLNCTCIYGKPEREADYLMSYLVKEVEFDNSNLHTEQIDKWIEDIGNAKHFISKSGLNTVVYYGNLNLGGKGEGSEAQERFWFNQTIASSELLTLLNKFEVQCFINSKLKIPAGKWTIIEDKRKIRINCHCLAEVDHLVPLILSQVWCVSRPEKVCQNDAVKQFLKDHSKFVEIKQDEYFCTFYVTVDLKDELECLLEAETGKNADESFIVSVRCDAIERVSLYIEPGIRKYLIKKFDDEIKKICEHFNVRLSYIGASFEFNANSRDDTVYAKQALQELIKRIFYQEDVVRIRREMSYEMLKKEMEKLEEKCSCSFTLSKKEDEEPEYLESWDSQKIRIIASEGSLECTRCDVLICFLDENWQPIERSAKKIFMTGGWTDLEDAVTKSKEVQKSWISTKSSKCKVNSSSETGFLKCRQLLFVSSENLPRDIEEIWCKVLGEVCENQWRSICFPVESSQISDGTLSRLLTCQAKEGYKKLESSLELQFYMWDTDKSLKKEIQNICNQHLSPEYTPINFTIDEDSFKDIKKGLHSSIEVKLKKGTFLEVAKANKVDVIVNSTNQKLNLEKGFVSSTILEKGGQGIKDELSSSYQHGIRYGDIAITSGHTLGFKKIFHGALYKKWVSTGNFSLKVLKCFMKRCLFAMEVEGFQTIAFPALGTGKLGYPYIPVAKTMMECVTEFGKQHPETCIQTVYIVVHEGHSVQVFEDVFENTNSTSPSNIADVLSKPTVSFLEQRIRERGILIQLLPEEIDELVDAKIEFSNEKSTSGEVDFSWCSSMGCYSAVMSVNKDHLQDIVDQCYKMLDAKRITSARIYVKDNAKDLEICSAVIDTFMKKIKPSIDRETCGLSLRKLQFLSSKEQFEKKKHKVLEQKNSWITNPFNKKDAWRMKTVKQQRDVLVSVLGPTSDQVKRALNEFREFAAVERNVTGKWCFRRDGKWIFVSTITNSKLNQAVEEGLSYERIKEDGIMYEYNFDEMKRYPGLEKGEKLPNEIICLADFEESMPIQGRRLWYVLIGDKWMLLQENTCMMLTQAKNSNKKVVFDDPHVYDLQHYVRNLKGKEECKERIIFIEASDDGSMASGGTDTKTMQSSTKGLNQTDEEKEKDIFEFVTGQITYRDMGNKILEDKIKRTLDSVGCKVISREGCTFFIKGSLMQIAKVNELMMTLEQKTKSLDTESFTSVVTIAMSNQEYKAFKYFGTECCWFKKYGNNLNFNGNGLICEIPTEDEKQVEGEMIKHLENVRMMSSDTEIIENQDCNIAAMVDDIQDKYPSVCLLINEKVLELISDSYEDLLKVKNLLQQQMSGKKNRRAGRTFEKTDKTGDSTKAESNGDVYRGNVYSGNRSRYTTQHRKELEVKTKEGLKIKIYEGSITRLKVDCIVNAANDRLMHGGGVAAAISEAAGYQLDQESRQYIEKNGPIPVGSCCVTSAGNLPCKFVIHTVGPRWDDYRDKNQCLQLLFNSVEVTFIEAEKMGLKSLAIPAISSGIFAVPRDLCVQQYYRAVMSFSSKNKSLQEIHFVDKDESMVRAIQEVFQPKEPIASDTMKSEHLEKKNNTPAIGAEESVSTVPLSNAYTIVNVSKNLQIKIHIGNITDIAAEAVVCPQDEYCHSEDVIAKDIFKNILDEKPVSKRMKLGNIFTQRLRRNSHWKMIIHAVSPVYDEEHAKDPTEFGKTLNTMIQAIMTTADKEKVESISIPLLGTGKGEYRTPVDICAFSFAKAIMANKSEMMFLKDIYLVLNEEKKEKIYLEHFDYKFEITNRTLVESGNSGNLAKMAKDMPEEGENCCICMDTPTKPKQLHKCGHTFCEECIKQSFQYKPACPSCGTIYGKVTGDQPPGTISIRKSSIKLKGFNDSNGTIVLTYFFDDGTQRAEHPNPGQVYKGISRSGYVPNNEKGRLIAKLLNVAFSRRLVFTIGRSRTTGHDGVITWNDIHHKTRIDGGPARFGYPDPTYLDRVLEELGAKGVTEESADDPEEFKEYSRQIEYTY